LKKPLAQVGLGTFSRCGAPMERHFNLLAIHHSGVWLNRDNLFALGGFSHMALPPFCVFNCVPLNTASYTEKAIVYLTEYEPRV